MKLKEIRELSTEELHAKVYELKEQLFEARRKQSVGQLENGKVLTNARKDIARIYTVIRERELGMK